MTSNLSRNNATCCSVALLMLTKILHVLSDLDPTSISTSRSTCFKGILRTYPLPLDVPARNFRFVGDNLRVNHLGASAPSNWIPLTEDLGVFIFDIDPDDT